MLAIEIERPSLAGEGTWFHLVCGDAIRDVAQRVDIQLGEEVRYFPEAFRSLVSKVGIDEASELIEETEGFIRSNTPEGEAQACMNYMRVIAEQAKVKGEVETSVGV